MPIATEWYAVAPATHDYIMAFFLANGNNEVVAQAQDNQPVAGFYPTSQWLPFSPIWDHRSIRLPHALPSGEYELWLAVYYFDSAGQLVRLTSDLTSSTEYGTIAPLPIKILVEN